MKMNAAEITASFYNWLSKHVAPEEQADVVKGIFQVLHYDHSLVETHSWPELRNMAERRTES